MLASLKACYGLHFRIYPEFCSQEELAAPLENCNWNDLELTRELAISAKRKLTCCFCITYSLFIDLDRWRTWECTKGFFLELCTVPHRIKMVILPMFAILFDWKQLVVLIDIQLLFLGLL
jgi:hypothetical protein